MSLSEEYREYCNKFKAVWEYLNKSSKDLNTITEEICKLRNYYNSEERWNKILKETGVAFVTKESCDYDKLKGEKFKDLALFSKEGNFLLNERYIIPVRDMLGNIIALIGWYPDSKKYITTPSKFFSKDCLFFGLEQLKKTNIGKEYFVVEGIFDSLALRSLGFNAVAQMGIVDSRLKVIMYGLFNNIVAIPDNDKQGHKVVQKDGWNIPRNSSYLKWVGQASIGDENINIKDIDNLINIFEEEDIKEVLRECFSKKERVIKLSLE